MPMVGYPERIAATEKRLKDTGVNLLDVEFFWIKPDTKIRDFAPYLEAAARLGAGNLLAGAADPDKTGSPTIGSNCAISPRFIICGCISNSCR